MFFEGAFIEADKEQYLGFSTDYEEQESKGAQIHIDHQITENIRWKTQLGYKEGGREAGNSGYIALVPFVIPGFSDAASGLAFRSAFDQKRESEAEYLASHIAWEFETGGISHEFVIGANYSKAEITNIGYFNSVAGLIADVLGGNFAALFTLPPSVNIFNPATVPYQHLDNFGSSPPFYRDTWEFENAGLNLQDAIDIPSMNMHVLLGLRYSRASSDALESAHGV